MSLQEVNKKPYDIGDIIRLRTRFDIKHISSVTPKMKTLYKNGLKRILSNKKDILIMHKAYLRKNLPQDLVENLRKVGISFD